MLTNELQIYKDTYNLCKVLMTYNDKVPRTVRYGEYATAIKYAFHGLDILYKCNSDRSHRAAYLNEYIYYLLGVKNRIQLFADTKKLSIRQATNIVLLSDKVLKQATGWRNAS